MAFISIENISFSYSKKKVIENFSLQVEKGTFTTLLGESGCGKSTVAHSIMNLLPGGNEIITGEIIFKGKNIRESSQKEMEAINGL